MLGLKFGHLRPFPAQSRTGLAYLRLFSSSAREDPASTVLYEYDGSKRLVGLRNGVGGVAIYLGARTGFQFATGITSTFAVDSLLTFSPFEVAAFAFVLSQQALYLRKLVSKMTLSADSNRVSFRAFNFLGQPTSRTREFEVSDLVLTTGEEKLFLKPRSSKKRHEYFILQRRDVKIEQLFSPYERF